jgi:hypothetical protein
MDAPHRFPKPASTPNSLPELTRRDLLAKGTWLLAGVALPLPCCLASQPQETHSAKRGKHPNSRQDTIIITPERRSPCIRPASPPAPEVTPIGPTR